MFTYLEVTTGHLCSVSKLLVEIKMIARHGILIILVVIGVDKKRPKRGDTLWNNGSNPRVEMAKAVNDYIWSQTKSLTGVGDRAASKSKKKDKLALIKSEEEAGLVVNESEVKRRRYTSFMSDLVSM